MTLITDRRRVRIWICLILVLSVILSWTGIAERFLGFCGLDIVSEFNDKFLQSSFERSLKLFGILSAVKIGLSVVEGTEVGVGFGLQIGRLVKAANDYVHIAWKTVLVASIILLGTQYLLQTTGLLDQWFLTAALLLSMVTLAIGWGFPRFRRIHHGVRNMTTTVAFFTLALYLIVPFSVSGGALLSKYITEPSLESAESQLNEIKEEMFSGTGSEETGLQSIFREPKKNLEKVLIYLKEKTRELATLVFKLIAVFVFDCIIFPLTLLVFLVWLTKTAASYFVSSWQAQYFKEDLAEIIEVNIEKVIGAAEKKKVGGNSF